MKLPPIYIIISGIFVSSLAFLRCIIHPPKLQPQDECIDEFHIGVVECHIMRRRGHYLKIIAHHGKITGQIRCNPWHVSSYEYNNICYTLLFYNYRRPTNRGWKTRGVATSSPIAHRCTPRRERGGGYGTVVVVRRRPVRFPCVYQTKLILGAPALLPVSDTHPAVGGSSKLPSGFARYIPAPCGSSTYQ